MKLNKLIPLLQGWNGLLRKAGMEWRRRSGFSSAGFRSSGRGTRPKLRRRDEAGGCSGSMKVLWVFKYWSSRTGRHMAVGSPLRLGPDRPMSSSRNDMKRDRTRVEYYCPKFVLWVQALEHHNGSGSIFRLLWPYFSCKALLLVEEGLELREVGFDLREINGCVHSIDCLCTH